MKPSISYTLIAAALACGLASAQTTAYTTPVGYTVTSCLPNSDTIVGLPLRVSAAAAGALASAPAVNVLTIGSAAYTVNQFAGTHYAKFSTGTDAGKWFAITANDATTLTLDLNGDTLTAVAGNTLEVIKFWTLAELFDPAAATTDPATTPNAIVASTSTLASGRRTEILIPNFAGVGTNLAPTTFYYVNAGIWKKSGAGNTSFNNDQLWPDSYFIIRNPVAVATATKYTITGEVEMNAFAVGLGTQAAGKQDNFIALPRPINVTFNQLGLGGTSAFVESTSTLASGRRDELLTFDNAAAARNKAPSAFYYRHAGIWKKSGSGNTDVGTDVIPGGFGFIIRKYQGTGATATWTNTAPY